MKLVNRGFSLLEVLVALSVVSIALSAGISLMSRSVDNLTVLERKTIATWVGENQIAYMRINQTVPSSGLEGEEEMAGRIWYWKAEIETTEDESVMRLLMSVSLNRDMRRIESELTAYLPVLTS